MVRWAIDMHDVAGPLNATAPAPVTNRELARCVGRAIHRPALMRAPSFAVRLILGEMADAMILNGQRVLPAKATRHGFQFRYPDLDAALQQIYRTASI
jgi:NAD dependent epimerase/dehydratase family enzyme